MPKRTRHIIPISGKDSLCAAIVQQARRPDLPYEYLFCDVRMELPETYAWLEKVEDSLDITIHRVGKSLVDIIHEQGLLPSHQRRFCTKYGKIYPLYDYLGNDDAIQYVGIRADEDRPGVASVARPNLKLEYPLKWAGVDLPGVYKILGSRGLLPPSFFWQRLWDRVRDFCGDHARKWLDETEPWVRSYLFSWRSRSNCYLCFYQRLYEWVGLLEHHPDLFAAAEELEREVGKGGGKIGVVHGHTRSEPFYFLSSKEPLQDIRNRARWIFGKRIRAVLKVVRQMQWKNLDNGVDLLELTSCGIYCGK